MSIFCQSQIENTFGSYEFYNKKTTKEWLIFLSIRCVLVFKTRQPLNKLFLLRKWSYLSSVSCPFLQHVQKQDKYEHKGRNRFKWNRPAWTYTPIRVGTRFWFEWSLLFNRNLKPRSTIKCHPQKITLGNVYAYFYSGTREEKGVGYTDKTPLYLCDGGRFVLGIPLVWSHSLDRHTLFINVAQRTDHFLPPPVLRQIFSRVLGRLLIPGFLWTIWEHNREILLVFRSQNWNETSEKREEKLIQLLNEKRNPDGIMSCDRKWIGRALCVFFFRFQDHSRATVCSRSFSYVFSSKCLTMPFHLLSHFLFLNFFTYSK